MTVLALLFGYLADDYADDDSIQSIVVAAIIIDTIFSIVLAA